jgi:surface antigen
MKNLRRAIFVLAIVAATPVATPVAIAAGWGSILSDGPGEDFHDEDVRMFMDAVGKTLDGPVDSPPLEWRNDKTGAGGSLVVRGQPKVKGYDECRRLRATLYSSKRKGKPFGWTACKDPAGHWLVLRMG